MSSLTQAQRDKLPTSAFGDPGRRLFPILDQDDVDSAAHLIGKAKNPDAVKARIKEIAKAKGLKIPDAWKTASMAHFATLDAATYDGDWVIRTGKLFEAGAYVDKAFSMTPQEIHAAADGFTPCPVDLEHVPTLLDGKLGEVRSLHASEDGRDLYGTVALPKWLDDALPERKVSATWDRATKMLTGLALVRDPRVTDAALMASFAGRRHSASDQGHVQSIHDSSLALGAACTGTDTENVQDDHIADGVTLPGRAPGVGYSKTPADAGKGRKMNLKDWFRSKAVADGVELSDEDFAAFGAPAPDPRVAALEAELAAHKAQFSAKEQATRQADAARFADAQIQALHLLPAGRDALVALYASAAEQDAAGGTVTFANGEKHAHVDALTAVFAALPAHTLTQERLLADGQSVLMARSTPDPDAPMSAERRAKLLGLSPLGQSVARGNGTH